MTCKPKFPGGLGYVLDCFCGWRSPFLRSDDAAEDAWQAHAHGGWTLAEQAARWASRATRPRIVARVEPFRPRRRITDHPLWARLTRRAAA